MNYHFTIILVLNSLPGHLLLNIQDHEVDPSGTVIAVLEYSGFF